VRLIDRFGCTSILLAAVSSTPRRLHGESFFDEALVMSRGAPAADSRICRNGRLQARVAEQLPHRLEVSRFRIQHPLCTHMTKLVA
jgi:hypothetical protein